MTEPSLLQGEERGGSDALAIVTDERRRPCGKIGPPLRGRPEEPAGLRCLLARSFGYASALRALPAGSSGRS